MADPLPPNPFPFLTPSYAGGRNSICRADTPYPSVSQESVPSQIDNLTNALYGAITKTVQGGRVIWNIPCDPTLSSSINGIPRNTNEGLLCYIMRALNLTIPTDGFVTVNGTQTLANKTLTAPVINGGSVNSTTINSPTINTATINTATINNLTATGTLALPSGSITTSMIANGSIIDIDISASAAIATSKLAPVTATGSTTARTLDNRFADFANVKDFGAKGDGTTDDTTAIQAAFTAANGGPVLFPKGQYYIASAPYSLSTGNGAISFNDGASKDVWLQTRKLTGTKAVGSGTLGGFSPSGFMFDLQEDCSISSDFMVANRTRHRFGGSSVTGGRIGVLGQLFQTAATSSSNTNRNYVGIEGSVTAQSSDGGTNTTTDAKGAYFGGNLVAYIGSSSTNLLNVSGAEINTFVSAGASSKYQFGLNVACANAQKATGYDAAINISGYNDGTITHAGYGVGVLFSSASGAEPFSPTSTIIAAVTGSGATVQEGIDFSSYTITNNILKGKYSRLSESKLTVGDSSGFAVIQGGSQSTNASLLLRSKGNGSVYLQDETGTVTILRADVAGSTVTQAVRPDADGTRNLGTASFRWSTVYAATGAINTSDAREKQQIEPVDTAVLAAWKKVNFRQFKFNDAVEQKGDKARFHVGVIAQQVKEAFESEGLDAFEYGILCYDEWDAQEEIKDDEGNVIQPAREAGNRYGVRYEEALALECAYQRVITESLLKRIETLEAAN